MLANFVIFSIAVALVLTYLSVIHLWLGSERTPGTGHC